MPEKLTKSVFDWEHFTLYLAGPMEHSQDSGVGWRDIWTEKLVQIGINSNRIYNPCKKPFNASFNLNDEARIIRECREKEDWQKLDEMMGQIMHTDLRLVDKSDLVLVNMPRIGEDNLIRQIEKEATIAHDCLMSFENLMKKYMQLRVPAYGTIHEIVVAHWQRKPIFMVWEDTGLSDCSAWLMKLIGYKNIFSNIDSLITHLKSISKGDSQFNAKQWLLVN